jgi:YD repeat-containing protein
MARPNQGRLDRTDHADGSAESSDYDANGNVITQTDRASRITRMVYDAANQIQRGHPQCADDEQAKPRTRGAESETGELLRKSGRVG